MKAILIVTLAGLGLSGCMDAGYRYAYDPYLGQTGHYTGPYLAGSVAASPACQRVEFRGPYYNGYRGPYYAGPYCVTDGAAVDAAARAPAGSH